MCELYPFVNSVIYKVYKQWLLTDQNESVLENLLESPQEVVSLIQRTGHLLAC